MIKVYDCQLCLKFITDDWLSLVNHIITIHIKRNDMVRKINEGNRVY